MTASTTEKYRPFAPVRPAERRWPDRVVDRPPQWCAVDLRDGNQALASPMGVAQKTAYFKLLAEMGFKQIEVGFPAASQTEYDFIRSLIEGNRIPDDVAIQILCQARPELIRRSMEAIAGARDAIFHLYLSTSPAQRRHTFGLDRPQLIALAVSGVRAVQDCRAMFGSGRLALEFSPESFTQTEPEFALEICRAVQEAWQDRPDRPLIINLPSTVEVCAPNQYADLLEWFAERSPRRDDFVLSVHTHNDRSCGVAASEMALLAGAQRVEGTLFGFGERTGNADLVSLALNLESQGVDSGLDFSDLPALAAAYADLTGQTIHPRHPYAGELVFTAFSGGHQDAIAKGLAARAAALRERDDPAAVLPWTVPYLPLDPADIGCSYEAVIRVNGQSGKGGVAYVLRSASGIEVPKPVQGELGTRIYSAADRLGREMTSAEIVAETLGEFGRPAARVALAGIDAETPEGDGGLRLRATLRVDGAALAVDGRGNGPIAAFVDGLARAGWPDCRVLDFHESALSAGSAAQAAAWVQLERHGARAWGLGVDESVSRAGMKAVLAAIDRLPIDTQ